VDRLEPCRGVAAVTRSANRSSIADDSPELQQLSVQVFSCHFLYVCACTAKGQGLLESLKRRRRQRLLGSHGNTREAYLLASLNSEIAAMLLLRLASAESTPAVTSAASCTMRLWLITPANSRPLLLSLPLEWYSS